MAVLETVTQMADQYRNSEQERNSTKDEQLRSLEMENRALEQKLEKTQAQADKQREIRSELEGKMQRLVEEVDCHKYQMSVAQKETKQQQAALNSIIEERDHLRQENRKMEALVVDLKLRRESLQNGLNRALTDPENTLHGQEAVVKALEKEKQALQDTNTDQTKELLDERAMSSKVNESLARSLTEIASLKELSRENLGHLSEARTEIAKLKSMLTSFEGQNQQFKGESERNRNEVESLKAELWSMKKEMRATNGALSGERKTVYDLKKHAEQLQVQKKDPEMEITRLKLDLEKSRSHLQVLEHNMEKEADYFNHRKQELENELYVAEEALAMRIQQLARKNKGRTVVRRSSQN